MNEDAFHFKCLQFYNSSFFHTFFFLQLAMKLLEKDIHDKQETLIALRRQLEDIKKINLELHNNWQVSEATN